MSWQAAIEELHRLKTRKGRRASGHFSVEGYRLIERALESEVPLRRVVAAQSLGQRRRGEALLESLQKARCPVSTVPDEALQPFLEGRTFGAVLGIVEALAQVSLEELLAAQGPCKLLVLVEVMDPGNLGALARTAMASGVSALVAVGGTDLFHAKAVRTSMGALYDLPTCQLPSGSWEDLLHQLHAAQVQTIGAVVQRGLAPFEAEIGARHALFMGSEAHGLPEALQQALELRWTIPMPAQIDSYSVNAATAILLYELNRRSWLA